MLRSLTFFSRLDEHSLGLSNALLRCIGYSSALSGCVKGGVMPQCKLWPQSHNDFFTFPHLGHVLANLGIITTSNRENSPKNVECVIPESVDKS